MNERRRGRGSAGWARALAGLLIAIAGLWIAFRRVDPGALGAALRGASWSWFAAAAVVAVAAVWVRAWRWRLLLLPIARVPLDPLFSATMIGYFGNNVLPLRLGELMRAIALGRSGRGVDAGTALGSVAVERLLDVASALVAAALVLALAGEAMVGRRRAPPLLRSPSSGIDHC